MKKTTHMKSNKRKKKKTKQSNKMKGKNNDQTKQWNEKPQTVG